ncbi:hemerythrin domain-containing protein [Streptomyces sp. NPDC048172]|uniref:hemerythrin domain-containing protein n=1 Tax=Streptomyces sp. NPDC048172 TaxID=3365505 RepID=UPI003719C682
MTTSGNLDLTMMYAAHDAFRRDLGRMAASGSAAELRPRWRTFTTYLTAHHSAEDDALWPAVRARSAEAGPLLDAMEAEHAVLDPLMSAVDTALAEDRHGAALAVLAELAEALTGHLDHEEREALPLVDAVLPPEEWAAFGAEQRRRLGSPASLARFVPWLLDGAEEERRRAVLRVLPPPVRLLHRAVWNPRYRRQEAR